MKKRRCKQIMMVGAALACLFGVSACGTAGSAASDLGLAGAGGIAGYQLSDGKIGGAAAGAVVGYLGSRIAQAEVQHATTESEKRGYDRAMNQAVKQQYWIIQRQQREPVSERDSRLVPVVIPESNINGVIQKAHVEYLRVEP